MLSALILSNGIEDVTGGSANRAAFPPVITHVESPLTETPSPYDAEKLLLMERATGYLYIEDDPGYIADKAFRFMQSAAKVLPFSEEADRAADALAKRVRGELKINKLTKKIGE